MDAEIIRIIASVSSALAIIISLFIFISRSRRVILATKLSDDVLWMIYYFLMGTINGNYTAGMMNIIAFAREIVFYNRDKKWASSRLWLYFFLALAAAFCAFTWTGLVSALPSLGTGLYVTAFWMKDPHRIRLISLPAQILWLIYNIIIGAVFGIIGSVIPLVSITIGLIRDHLVKKSENSGAGA